MSKKFFVLGLFLAAGFLFLNAGSAAAADKYWTGNAATSTADGGKDFWNVANWDTAVPSSGDNIFLFATSSPNNTIVISTPVNLGAGNIFVGYNQKGNTLANSSAPLNLLIKEGASLTNTGTFTVGTSSTVFLNSGSLSVGVTNIQQLASTTINAISTGGATSTVTIAGNFTLGAGALYTSPANSTTTISGTSTFYATSTPTFGYLLLSGGGTTKFQTSVTVANKLGIAAGQTLNAGGGTITLSGSNSNSSTFPLEITGTFTAATSTVTYSGTGATTVASTTFATVNFNGATTYSLGGATTISTAGTVASGATLAVGTYTLTATGATWTNNGTVTEGTGGTILNAATVQFTNSSGTAISSIGADNNGSIYLTVTDPDQNLVASVIKTLTATITAKSGISTTQTATLTETSAGSGIFRGGLTFTLSGTAVTGALAYQGNGTLNYSWTDAQDSSDTSSCTACATFTGTAPGGGGGGSATASTATTATTASPAAATAATTSTTATQTATTTSTAAQTTTTQTTAAATAATVAPAAPTLDSVQTKIASITSEISALPKNPSSSQLTNIQSEIAAVLSDLQKLQPAAGTALGFSFAKLLAFGMTNNDVKNLQTALKTDSSIYPDGKITGYFGPLTLKAVEKFHEKYGIASSGKAGYGNVGPKTRAKLNELFGTK